MPFIPRKQKKRAYQPPKAKFQRKAKTNFYNKTRWRKLRKAYINKNPFCQICLWGNKVSEAKFLDHLIRIEAGGAEYDERNLLGMCEKHHNIKSGKEAHNSILIDYTRNKQGEMIPINKKDILKIYQ